MRFCSHGRTREARQSETQGMMEHHAQLGQDVFLALLPLAFHGMDPEDTAERLRGEHQLRPVAPPFSISAQRPAVSRAVST